jgi:hypothetical protein
MGKVVTFFFSLWVILESGSIPYSVSGVEISCFYQEKQEKYKGETVGCEIKLLYLRLFQSHKITDPEEFPN